MIRSRKQTTFGKLRRIRTLDRSRIEYRINLIDGDYISILKKPYHLFNPVSNESKTVYYYEITNSRDDSFRRSIKWNNAVSNAWVECRRLDSI